MSERLDRDSLVAVKGRRPSERITVCVVTDPIEDAEGRVGVKPIDGDGQEKRVARRAVVPTGRSSS